MSFYVWKCLHLALTPEWYSWVGISRLIDLFLQHLEAIFPLSHLLLLMRSLLLVWQSPLKFPFFLRTCYDSLTVLDISLSCGVSGYQWTFIPWKTWRALSFWGFPSFLNSETFSALITVTSCPDSSLFYSLGSPIKCMWEVFMLPPISLDTNFPHGFLLSCASFRVISVYIWICARWRLQYFRLKQL